MGGFFVGPMPVEQFVRDFLPTSDDLPPPPVFADSFFHDMKHEKFKKELDMCTKFEEYMPKDLIPQFKIVNTSNNKDRDSSRRLRPDPTLYHADTNTDNKKTQFDKLELHFELKKDGDSDPFQDPGEKADKSTHNFETRKSEARILCRGQLLSYATEWFSRQHRCFGFTVFMGDPDMRFIRWDRSGAVVSAKFNYRENCQPLIRFLWRFTHLSPADRGWDTTVRVANPFEVGLANDHLARWKNDLRREVVVFKVQDGEETREFIAWGAMAYPESLTGRCTRAYPVYEKKTGRLFFLKDSWRAEGLEKEAAILRELKKAKVQHVPGYICGDDLPSPYGVTVTDRYIPQREQAAAAPTDTSSISSDHVAPQQGRSATHPEQNTTTCDFVIPSPESTSWRCGHNWNRIIRRYHHRMITDVVGNHLKTFSSSKEMMKAVSHAFTAHRQAYENCTIIHRDISAYNILITDEGEGILNDWDLAKYEKDIKASAPRHHERTGTWQFMSCLLLMDKNKRHTIQDDMESFFYIILYHCIRYLEHNKHNDIKVILSEIFDRVIQTEDGAIGGTTKRSLVSFKGKLVPFKGFQLADHAPLNAWLRCAFITMDEWLVKVEDSLEGIDEEELRGLQLYSHEYLANQFAHSLSQLGWPLDDKAVDRLPAGHVGITRSLFESAVGSSTGSESRSTSQKRSLPPEELDEGDEESGFRSKPKKHRKARSKASESSRTFHTSMNMDNI